MKSTCQIIAALLLCSLSSCKAIGPLFKVPGQLLTAVGGGLGMLTDEAPQPYEDESPIEAPIPQVESPTNEESPDTIKP